MPLTSQYSEHIYLGGKPPKSSKELDRIIRDNIRQDRNYTRNTKGALAYVAYAIAVILGTFTVAYGPSGIIGLIGTPALMFLSAFGSYNGSAHRYLWIPAWIVAAALLFLPIVWVDILMLVSAYVALVALLRNPFSLWRSLRQEYRIRYWGTNTALMVLSDLYEKKGGSNLWLRRKAMEYGDITRHIDRYLEVTEYIATTLQDNLLQRGSSSYARQRFWRSGHLYGLAADSTMLAARSLVLDAAEHLVDYILSVQHQEESAIEEQRAAVAAEKQQQAEAEQVATAFLEQQQKEVEKQTLIMAKSDVESFIADIPSTTTTPREESR